MQISATSAKPRKRLVVRAASAGLVGAAAWYAWPQVIGWQQRQFAEGLAAHAVQFPATATVSIRELQYLGVPATEPLMSLATSQRAEVAEPAQQALADQLTTWEIEFAERQDAAVFARRLTALSTALQTQAPQLGDSGRRWAQLMSRRIVQQVEQLPAQEAWPVLTACEAVLTLSPPPRKIPPQIVESAETPPTPVTPINLSEIAAPAPAIPARLPKPAPLRAETSEPAPAMSDLTIKPISPPAELSVIMPSTQPLSVPSDPVNPLRSDAEASAAAPITLDDALHAATLSTPIDIPSPLDLRHAKQRLRELSDRQLIEVAETASRFEAAAARQVLKSRGFSDDLLRLTRELQQLPAPQRRDSLERASTLPATEARRLLRWFLADADADVRLHALTLLATTGDPQLTEIARERAVEDADPRVADLATKLLK